MLRFSLLASLLVLSLYMLGSLKPGFSDQMMSQPSDSAAIAAQIEAQRKAFEARDLNGVMAVYAPGNQLFVFDAVPPREYRGWAAYKQDWAELFQLFPGPIKDTISEVSISVVGPMAYTHKIEDTLFTQKDGSKKRLVVRETDVYRMMNGKWLIVLEHVSFPVDPMTGKADLLSKP